MRGLTALHAGEVAINEKKQKWSNKYADYAINKISAN